jgi:uncharacterized delta-60 repeat protein
MRLVLALAAVACVLAAIAALAAADDTTETTTFGADGIATQSLGVHFEETQFLSVEARSDGGLVGQRDQQLESYLADGTPDPAVPPQPVSYDRRVFPLAGGKSLVAAESTLTRVNADGSVDPSFGGTGTIKMPPGVQAAAELPSGKVLVAGVASGGTHGIINTLTAALVNPDGSIDQGVGTKGFLTLSLPSNVSVGGVSEIALTSGGGALVFGGTFMLDLRADGSPNPGFGSAGLVTELPNLVGGRVLSDDSIEAVGSGRGPDGGDLIVLRYTAAGTPNLGFGANGQRSLDLGAEEEAHDALWAADGSVVVGGSSTEFGGCGDNEESCGEVPILVGFAPNVSLDPGFGEGGILRLTALAGAPTGYPGCGVVALTRRPDGSTVAAGCAPPRRTIAFLAAISPAGALLPGFGEGGIVRVRRPVPAIQVVAGLARLADGKLLAAGTTDVGFDSQPVLVRYGADGGLDGSFGAGAGYVALGGSHFASGFAANASGQALVGISGYPHSQILLRDADGAPVPTFGAGGTVQLPKYVRVEALGFAADGGAIVVGSRDVAGDAEPGVVIRLGPNGQRVSGFGHHGRVVLRPSREMRARTLAAAGGDRTLVGGLAGPRFAMVRLLPSGRPDPRFASRGWSLARAGGVAKSVLVRRVGSRIYLAGVALEGNRYRVVLLRFGADGRPDPSFGRHGRLTAFIAKAAQPKAIVPTRGGVLVVLSRGPKPLLQFGRDGGVRRRPVGQRPQFVGDVRATVSDGQLILGWNAFSRAIRRDVYYLGRRALPIR